MRLTIVKNSLRIAQDNFKPKLVATGGTFYCDNVDETKIGIEALKQIGVFEYSGFNCDVFYDILSTATNRIILDSSTYNRYKKEFEKIDIILKFMVEWIEYYTPNDDTETTISIKFPELNNLTDLAISSVCIKKAFSQVVSEIGGTIRVKQFDYGSNWVIIDVGVIEAVKLIGAIISSAYAITLGVLNLIKLKEEIKALKLDNKIKSTDLEEKEFIKAKSMQEAEKINKEYFNKDDNEREGRISVSISEFVKILRAGGEVHPSLNAPTYIEDMYPKLQTSITFTPIALLTQQNSEDTDNANKSSNEHEDRSDNKQN